VEREQPSRRALGGEAGKELTPVKRRATEVEAGGMGGKTQRDRGRALKLGARAEDHAAAGERREVFDEGRVRACLGVSELGAAE